MNIKFIREVYNLFKDEFKQNYGLKVIAFKKNGFLIDVVSNEEELKRVLKNPNLYGLVADFTSEGNLGVQMDTETISSDVTFLNDIYAPNYALEQEMVNSGKDVRILELSLVYNNRFVHALDEFFLGVKNEGLTSTVSTINTGDKTGRLPVFRVLTVESGTIKLFVTDNQMSFITSVGLVKIHNVGNDIDFQFLVEMLSRALGAPQTVLENLFMKDYSKQG